MILNAQLATQSQSCTARYCPHDSDPGSDLCTMHIRLVQAGVPIVLHVVEQPATPDTATHLWCSACPGGGAWRPDAEFNQNPTATPARRGRRGECRACDVRRRQEYRANLDTETLRNRRIREAAQKRARAADPAVAARRRAKDAARRQQLRDELEAVRQAWAEQ